MPKNPNPGFFVFYLCVCVVCGGGGGGGGVYSYYLILSQQILVLDIVSKMMTDWQTIDSVEIVQFSNFLNSLIWIYCIW